MPDGRDGLGYLLTRSPAPSRGAGLFAKLTVLFDPAGAPDQAGTAMLVLLWTMHLVKMPDGRDGLGYLLSRSPAPSRGAGLFTKLTVLFDPAGAPDQAGTAMLVLLWIMHLVKMPDGRGGLGYLLSRSPAPPRPGAQGSSRTSATNASSFACFRVGRGW